MLLFLLSTAAHSSLDLKKFLPGQWDFIEVSAKKMKTTNVTSDYTAYVSALDKTDSFVVNAWKNAAQDEQKVNEVFDSYLTSFKMNLVNETSVELVSNDEQETMLTRCTLNETNPDVFIARGSFGDKNYILSIMNVSIVSLMLFEPNSASFVSFAMVNTRLPTVKESFFGKYKVVMYVGAAVVVIQVFMWVFMRRYQSNLSEKLDVAAGKRLKSL